MAEVVGMVDIRTNEETQRKAFVTLVFAHNDYCLSVARYPVGKIESGREVVAYFSQYDEAIRAYDAIKA